MRADPVIPHLLLFLCTTHTTAIGVMATVSGVELWWHSAAQLHDFVGVTAAVLGGAALFAVLDPLLPKPPETEELLDAEHPEKDSTAVSCSSSTQQLMHTSRAAICMCWGAA